MKHTKGVLVEKQESKEEYLERRIEALENEIIKQNPSFRPPKRKIFKPKDMA